MYTASALEYGFMTENCHRYDLYFYGCRKFILLNDVAKKF